MPHTPEFWRKIINDFNPVGPPRGEDVRQFFVDRNEENPTRSLVRRLKLNFQNSIGHARPYKALLTGHVGSGKSTELWRLAEALAEDFFVVWFDAESTLEATANQFDILLAIGLAVHSEATKAELNPPRRLAKDLTDSLAKFVRKHEERKGFTLKPDDLIKQVASTAIVAGAGVMAGPIVAGAAALAGLAATRLELNVRDELVRTLELPANRQAVIGALNRIIDFVQSECRRPLLIITDGLDKFSAARAKALFADSALLTEPACALMYTAPIEFYHRLTAGQVTNLFNEYKILPNPPVQTRPPTGGAWHSEREPNGEGLQVMRKIAARRIEARGRSVADVITDDGLTLLVQMSGGVIRELIRYFRDAATSVQLLGADKIDREIAQDIVNQHRQEIALRVNAVQRDALKRVLKQGVLAGGQQEPVEDELLRSLLLLSYQDQAASWFDAHPNVFALL